MEPNKKRKRTPRKFIKNKKINWEYEQFTTVFPNEILLGIFEFLSFKNLLNVALVCKHWCDLIKCPSLWKKIPIDLSFCNIKGKISKIDDIINIIKKFPYRNIKILCIGAIHLMSGTYEKKYQIRETTGTFDKIFNTCPKLKYLKINTDYDINRVGQVNENMLQKIGELSKGKLKGLCIEYLSLIKNKQSFEHFSNLKYLSIRGGQNNLGNLVNYISEYCHELISLDIDNKNKNNKYKKKSEYMFSDKSLELLSSNCPNLIYLKLTKFWNITHEGILSLALNCKNLITLRLLDCRSIDDSTLIIITDNFLQLKILELRCLHNIKISSEGYIGLENKHITTFVPFNKGNYSNFDPLREITLNNIFNLLFNCLTIILNKKYNNKNSSDTETYISENQIYEFFNQMFPLTNELELRKNSIILFQIYFISQRYEELIYSSCEEYFKINTQENNYYVEQFENFLEKKYDKLLLICHSFNIETNWDNFTILNKGIDLIKRFLFFDFLNK